MTRLGVYNVQLPRLPDLPGAACVGHDATLWDDTILGETPVQAMARHATARAICHDCPVRALCRTERGPRDSGMWGGELWRAGANGSVHRAHRDTYPTYRPETSDTDRETAVARMTTDGSSLIEIARALGVCTSTVSRIRSRLRAAGQLTDMHAAAPAAHHRKAG